MELKINREYFSSQDYQVPNWSASPNHNFFLEVIKEGSTIQQIPVSEKQFYLIGKNKQICDVILQNPSISRKHAILQFKIDDQHAYLYDLGSTHGTFVNKRKLPSKVYHKLNIFDSIQFGSSNRLYIFRCLDLQVQKDSAQQQQLTQFQKTLKKQNQPILSKTQIKQKYMDLLENDPYYKSNQISVKQFAGKKDTDEYDGISWGIRDQYDVYAYKNENQYPLQPELLRRLPGLDNNMLLKISQYQQKFEKYQQAQGQLRELANREQRQYGLEQKMRQKKERLQKKVVQFAEALEKVENHIKLHLFGQQNIQNTQNQKRQKEIDTFEDDQFYDRTKAKVQQINLNDLKNKQVSNNTEDYWNLKNRLQQLINRKSEYNRLLVQYSTKKQQIGQQMDELDKFMQTTQNKLKQQNYNDLIVKIKFNNEQMRILREKLEKIRPQEKLSNIIFKEDNQQIQKKKIITNNVQNTLSNLQKIMQKKQIIDEEDPNIFKYYEKRAKQEQKHKRTYKQYREETPIQQVQQQQIIQQKVKGPNRYNPRNKVIDQKQDGYVDLTKIFK